MSESEAITVTCGEVLNISRVGELYTELSMVLNENKPVEVDASSLERIDIAGIQLLLAFRQKVVSSGLDFSWQSPSENLIRAATLVGLAQRLGLSELP